MRLGCCFRRNTSPSIQRVAGGVSSQHCETAAVIFSLRGCRPCAERSVGMSLSVTLSERRCVAPVVGRQLPLLSSVMPLCCMFSVFPFPAWLQLPPEFRRFLSNSVATALFRTNILSITTMTPEEVALLVSVASRFKSLLVRREAAELEKEQRSAGGEPQPEAKDSGGQIPWWNFLEVGLTLSGFSFVRSTRPCPRPALCGLFLLFLGLPLRLRSARPGCEVWLRHPSFPRWTL